ncbi:uncharacterized protein LOC126573520 [Anopheles aquasalis]|uniref:uncharacterized protein LOC126573520 n=1 Tax=Anopheles aquasalis TaxID=42839 RepID=UPI00215A87D0|nr:uncharacterized protein LOC126573520 [Anopheles aquasalis]
MFTCGWCCSIIIMLLVCEYSCELESESNMPLVNGFTFELLQNQLSEVRGSISQLEDNLNKQSQTEELRKEILSLAERLKSIEQSMESDRTTLATQHADKQDKLESLQNNFTDRLDGLETRFSEKITQVLQNIDSYKNRLKTLEGGFSKVVSANEQLENSVKVFQQNTNQQMKHLIQILEQSARNRYPIETTTDIYQRVYNSCDDVPSSGLWKIRYGTQVTSTTCFKFT